MAKTAGFSRQRFYDLIEKGIFPEPIRSSRPMYSPELQEVVLSVVETGVGANGEFVLFNAKRTKNESTAHQESTNDDLQSVVESLAALGLSVAKKQVGQAIKELGISEPTSPDSIKAIFLHLNS
jgi:hypothetical protein